MNSYLLTARELFMEQKARDDNNPGVIQCRREMEIRAKYYPKTEQQKKKEEELIKKWEQDEIAGYGSIRYDYPEYHWFMDYLGKRYLRSSCNWNVYDYSKSSIIVGIWNDSEKKIEFIDDIEMKYFKKEMTKMNSPVE